MKPVHVTALNDQSIIRWMATEMALSDSSLGEGPILWEHPSVPFLQCTGIDIHLQNGSVYRMLSQLDDGNTGGYIGLYLTVREVIDTPCSFEAGSIYRTRELSELPVGVATVTVTESDGQNTVSRIDIVVGGRTVSCWAAEVDERADGSFNINVGDESILVQVDRLRPAHLPFEWE
ncbi:hypothetical protein [Massilia sp. CCM 8734]|uniref:hypothetical protein n=1 Tax=Massilia sp. CCM 8734 TaxID=2609283 RepID=UPI00141E17D2|nr:hypothetical protein [Massilia sp. CCM 8734]NHZ99747.1 hypothetical protein [Massilia sp. CCM 8734]